MVCLFYGFPLAFRGINSILMFFYIIKQSFIGVEGRELISIAGGGVRRKGKRVLFTQKYLHFVFIYYVSFYHSPLGQLSLASVYR